MKGLHISLVAALALCCMLSCGRRGGVMPRSVMEDVYVDLFLADQWMLFTHREKEVDTTMFYEPIFNKYGYTTEDFVKSVNYYLHDAKRYSRILRRAENRISGRVDYLKEQAEEGDRVQSMYEIISKYDHQLKLYYDTVYMRISQQAGLVFKADSAGRYMPDIPQEILNPETVTDSLALDSLGRDTVLIDTPSNEIENIEMELEVK